MKQIMDTATKKKVRGQRTNRVQNKQGTEH